MFFICYTQLYPTKVIERCLRICHPNSRLASESGNCQYTLCLGTFFNSTLWHCHLMGRYLDVYFAITTCLYRLVRLGFGHLTTTPILYVDSLISKSFRRRCNDNSRFVTWLNMMGFQRCCASFGVRKITSSRSG